MSATEEGPLLAAWEPVVYAAFFPAGIEDVVLSALSRLAIRYQLRLDCFAYNDPAVLRAGSSSPSSSAAAVGATNAATPKGLLLFRVRHCAGDEGNESTRAAENRLCLFLAAACCLRVIERFSLHLWSLPIAGRTNEEMLASLRTVITTEASHTQHSVLHVLSAVRATWGRLREVQEGAALPKATQLWGPHYFHSLHDDGVAFRVNCERRVMEESRGSLKSVELAAAAGDALWERYSIDNWEVSMLYHNVEFFLLQDNDTWLTAAVTLSPPAPPRCGFDIDVTFQYAAELLRQNISGALRRDAITLGDVKGLVPRVSSDRQEIRWSKGACAMRSSLAAALCTYAGVSEVAASTSLSPILMLDPFCGSGTTLLEGWVQVLENLPMGAAGVGGSIMGSELEHADVRRTLRNTRGDYLTWVAALYGYGAQTRQGTDRHAWDAAEKGVAAWRCAVEERVADVVRHGTYLTCGADGLRALLCNGIRGPPDVSAGTTASPPLSTSVGGAKVVPHVGCPFSVLRCNAMRIPVRGGTVECIVSDMPFGVRCGSHRANARLYPRFLRECHRLLRSAGKADAEEDCYAEESVWWRRSRRTGDGSGDDPARCCGGRAVLLTLELRLMSEALEALRTECPFRLVRPPFPVDMGGLYPYVFVLDKLS